VVDRAPAVRRPATLLHVLHLGPARRRLARAASGSANRVIKDVALAGSALGSAVRGYRVLGPHEALSLATMGLLVALVAAVAFACPRAFAYPLGALSVVGALTLLTRAWRARRR